ncbi:hypothetical protein GGTG_11642 [Gaeumannomyces tritici R3-111a-1]|uniref:Uncharacterized protein n=1 Tax=Gaeumannomyces tritici (strain R3-111a-1) TaxID=644352 RepID=J3PDR9_GAET3|nr:hypothetical protein GGTG_11642 [Gaeumannomyces tritici R3-111a-1]EJT70619.1 hypothetical protein GGTG_11642 [Gaeumannomyces tritici R3-111a-1]
MKFLSVLTILTSLAAGLSLVADNAVLDDATAGALEKRALLPAKPAAGKAAGGGGSPSPEPAGGAMLICRHAITPAKVHSMAGVVDHSKTDALMKSLGGHHVEVIVGNDNLGWKA